MDSKQECGPSAIPANEGFYATSGRFRRYRRYIWRYTDERWGETQADAYIRDIEAAMQRLATAPPPSARYDSIMPGYLRMRAGSHFVFAIATERELVVVRVLHQSMNFPTHLQDISVP